jgi:hypothetical protein
LLAAGKDALAMAALGRDTSPHPVPSERIAMDYAAIDPGLTGRRVRILAWAEYEGLFRHFSRYGSIPPEPVGTVTDVGDFGSGHLEVRLEITGFPRPFVFDGHEIELLI